jgi:hypothetical protein
MKRILIYILLVANLASGLAFAWDTHPEAAGHGSVVIDSVTGDDHSDGDVHHADHCCHGAAHLMGIFNAVVTPMVKTKDSHVFSLANSLPSLYITPLLRPPIV